MLPDSREPGSCPVSNSSSDARSASASQDASDSPSTESPGDRGSLAGMSAHPIGPGRSRVVAVISVRASYKSFAWTTTRINPIMDPWAARQFLPEGVVRSAQRGTGRSEDCTQDRWIKVAIMSVTDKPGPAEGGQSDLLLAIRRTGVIPERQYRAVRAKVKAGKYPPDPPALAERLVQDGGPDPVPGGPALEEQGARPGDRPLRDPRAPRRGGDGTCLQGPASADGTACRPEAHRPPLRLADCVGRPIPARD